MNERPILMQTDMVKAILDGRKTQTRRVIKPQPERGVICKCPGDNKSFSNYEMYQDLGGRRGWIPLGRIFYCPYGQVGDKLWVRETFYVQPDIYAPKTPTPIHYKADGNIDSLEDYVQKPSIFMPRWASRITLEITDIRVKRVQEITEQDAIAEGIKFRYGQYWFEDYPFYHGVKAYQALWGSINLKSGYGWDKNPFVWVISFKDV